MLVVVGKRIFILLFFLFLPPALYSSAIFPLDNLHPLFFPWQMFPRFIDPTPQSHTHLKSHTLAPKSHEQTFGKRACGFFFWKPFIREPLFRGRFSRGIYFPRTIVLKIFFRGFFVSGTVFPATTFAGIF